MNLHSVNSRNRTIMLIFALIYMIVNTIVVILVCNTEFISIYDRIEWNTKIILIISGLCFGGFFFVLRFIHTLSIKKLFLLFLIIRVLFLYCFIVFNYGVEYKDYYFYSLIPPHVLNGDIFTPYIGSWQVEAWRSFPPMFIWWYTYNYWVYGLNEILWRFVNLLLEVGIVYVIIQIFHENSATEKGWKEENFKIGLSLYIFSFIPIVVILLYASMTAFPVLLSLLGLLYFFRSKKNPKYLYYAVFFFGLATLTEGYAVFWLLVILVTVLFKKHFRQLFLLIGEIVAIFCLVSLPFLINDAIGYLHHYSFIFQMESVNWDGSIFVINFGLFNWPSSINYIPWAIALIISLFYIYKSYRFEISLDLFIVIASIFLLFGPGFSPKGFLWICAFISLNIIYSFRKFLITNLFFWGYFLFFILWLVSAYLTYTGEIFPWLAYVEIFLNWMPSMGYFTILPLIVHTTYQMGFIYLIYAYTKSKKLVLGLLIPFLIYYIFNICMPANSIFTPY